MESKPDTSTLISRLEAGDLKSLANSLDVAVSSDTALRHFFRDLFLFSVSSHPACTNSDGESEHPLIVLNALKNLASQRLESPSPSIAQRAITVCLDHERGGTVMQEVELDSNELNQPLFTQDFLQAVADGDGGRARHEAAKIALVSDNPASIIEMMMEVATHHMDGIGAFVYAVYRSAAFCGASHTNCFVQLLLSELTRKPRPLALIDEVRDNDLLPYLAAALEKGEDSDLSLLSTALRLWELDTVRQAGYRKGLSAWAARQFPVQPEAGENGKVARATPVITIMDALETSNREALTALLLAARETESFTWATDLAEKCLEASQVEDTHFVTLDALQALVKASPVPHVPLIAKRLIRFADSLRAE